VTRLEFFDTTGKFRTVQETEFGEVVSLSKISISAESPTLLRCANLSGFHLNHISWGGVGVFMLDAGNPASH